MRSCAIILAGLAGSGKTFVSTYFVKKEIPLIKMGDVTREELYKREIVDSPENEDKIRRELRQTHGPFVYAKRVAIKVFEYLKENNIIFIEGMRSFDEAVFFKKELPNIFILFLKADARIRYQRLSSRKNRKFNQEQARERDEYEGVTLGLNTIEKKADFVVTNNDNKKKLQKKLDIIYKKLSLWIQESN